MKKALLSLVLLGGLSSVASAQSVRFGLKAGATLANFRGDDIEDTKSIYGYHAGFAANLGITEHLSLQPELLYSQKGTKLEEDNVKLVQRLHYIDIPLLVKYNFGGAFVEAGPQFGLLVSYSSKLKDDNDELDLSDLEYNPYTPSDVGFVVGAGYQLGNGLTAGVRYNGGLSRIAAPDYNNKLKVHNSAFQVQIGYMFGSGE
ncbi:porin family protein [Hymenobacter psychrotolerans]|uniref:Outer membrane protein beta-barrel domain-containing protein n=1 Tax=Hymenobacter psychrotolerans DSM 18569 TaxID=1121959 RepID=A0A1M6Z058_9BACT|nr:porin family protein [Hymenobacter psychrotolerans]SHL23921.1 Outer membrane protein beta-barrel domain-containing protein [Hymenobacter psychrotolerans DSM 18569]